MNTIFKIQRKSGTYAELLETYGLANLLNNFSQQDDSVSIHAIEDSIYEVRLNYPPDMSKQYFPLFKYIKPIIKIKPGESQEKFEKRRKEFENNLPNEYYDFPVLYEWKKEKQNAISQIHNSNESRETKRGKIEQIELFFDTNKPVPLAIDTFAQIQDSNNFSSFDKSYRNLSQNKDYFSDFITEIIRFYTDENHESTKFDKFIKEKIIIFNENLTATQLLSPNQGKGLKAAKANSVNGGNFKSSWISETMKISGALSDMICQPVKVGTSYDLKVFIPEYKDVNYSGKTELIKKFRKYIKGNTPVKIDILNILLLTQLVIEHYGFTGLRRKVKDIVSGLHSVYQKDLGRKKAVVNIGFIQVPKFIEISSREENQIWIEILEEQRKIIESIGWTNGKILETGEVIQGLQKYRNFISDSDIQSFFDFSFWYANYIVSQLTKEEKIRLFSTETLNKFYINMDTNELKLSEIIDNDGFKAVANAIRKSTVTLLMNKKDAEYDIRYGVAQTLQSKAKSKEELAGYIGDFISLYNSENAMKAEKTIKFRRPYVKDDELSAFYLLLDKFPSKLVGALLASYGFALTGKKNQSDEDDTIQNENTQD